MGKNVAEEVVDDFIKSYGILTEDVIQLNGQEEITQSNKEILNKISKDLTVDDMKTLYLLI